MDKLRVIPISNSTWARRRFKEIMKASVDDCTWKCRRNRRPVIRVPRQATEIEMPATKYVFLLYNSSTIDTKHIGVSVILDEIAVEAFIPILD